MNPYTIPRGVCVEYKKETLHGHAVQRYNSPVGNDFGDGKVKVWC